ncbi:hypothetical protein FRP1_24120 [Pseudonocardia sp. EC080625-04]|nr:hypothetical protein FRP1_24120 [Pseudonocardia sp. EC080625-04]
MQDDDDARRSRRTRRRAEGEDARRAAQERGPSDRPAPVDPDRPAPVDPDRPGTGARPPAGRSGSGPTPRPGTPGVPGTASPSGVMRVRGGRVPRSPGGPAPADPPSGPGTVPPGPPRTGPAPSGPAPSGSHPSGSHPSGPTPRGPVPPGRGPAGHSGTVPSGPVPPGPVPPDARPASEAPQRGPVTGQGGPGGPGTSQPNRVPPSGPGVPPPDRPDRRPHASGPGSTPPQPDRAPANGPDPTRSRLQPAHGTPPPAPGATAEPARVIGRGRGATDSRRTEAFDALVPRRLRRRYADDAAADAAADGRKGHDDGADADHEARATAVDDRDTTEDEPGSATPAPAGPARRRGPLRIAAAAAAVVVLAATAFGFAGRGEVYDGVRSVAALAPDSDAVLDAELQAGDRNVLVLGVQADRAGAPEAARTDTAVLVHRPAGGAPAVTLSVPATLEVPRPPCRRWDAATGSYGETVPAESRTAFATAYDIGGPACTVGVVQQLTGIPVSGFVAFDLAGAPDLVGAVGGIEVCTERPVVDPVLGPVVEGAGRVPLDGEAAVRFATASGAGDSSPANRVQRQQRVLAAALGDALSTSSLLTPGAPGRSAEGVVGALTADGVDAGEILSLAQGLGRAGTAGDGSTPVFLPLPVSEAPNTRGHLELRRSDARELFAALREHEPLPESATAPAARAADAPAAGTTVDLVDATGRPGAVDQVAEDLRARGYEIGAVTTGPATDRAEVRYSPDNTDAAGALVGTLPGTRPAPDPTGSGVLRLVVGAGDREPAQAVPATDADCS